MASMRLAAVTGAGEVLAGGQQLWEHAILEVSGGEGVDEDLGAALEVDTEGEPADSDRGQADQQQGKGQAHQAFSTSMRPFISMCMAWQNHEQ